MGALTEIYVDPAIAANSGSGTIGSPFGDVQYALNTATRDATNGNRINIKAGTAELPTGTISFATFGAPTAGAQLVIQGYTTTAGDGGIGEINCGGSTIRIFNDVPAYTTFRNLKLGNTGAEAVLSLGSHSQIIDCEVHTAAGEAGIRCHGESNLIIGCNIYGCQTGIHYVTGSSTGMGNYISNCTSGLNHAAGDNVSIRNIISCSGSQKGIIVTQIRQTILNNSILSAGGTGQGIDLQSGFSDEGRIFANNLIEGFSGSGGVGIKEVTGDGKLITHNAVYNCATAYTKSDIWIGEADNETLSATPFAKSGSNTFANRFTYFAPVDTGNVWGKAASGAYPVGSGLDKGAIQHAGGGAAPPNFNIIPQSA